MNNIDFDSIATQSIAHIESLLSEWLPGGKLISGEYVVQNPTRADNSAGSFKINIHTGLWGDFALSGAGHSGGDLISLYAYINHVSQAAAAKKISERLNGVSIVSLSAKIPTNQNSDSDSWSRLYPAPTHPPAPPASRKIKTVVDGKTKWNEYQIIKHWPYHDQTNNLLGYVCRYETLDGKETPPLTLWQSKTGETKWRWKSFPDPRPIYNLNRLANYPSAQICVVEGEKCAETFQNLIDAADCASQLIVTTWQGGVNAVNKTDFTPLHGRKIILWPDFDLKKYKSNHERAGELMPPDEQPGFMAMVAISEILHDHCEQKFIMPVSGKPDCWDVADAINDDHMSLPELIQFMQAHKTNTPNRKTSDSTDLPDQNIPIEDQPPEFDISPVYDEQQNEDGPPAPFKCLGYHGDYNFYLPNGTLQISMIRRDAHSQGALIGLCDKIYWERKYPSKKGPRWSDAANDLIRMSERAGVYDARRQRGRGAWFDSGRSVLHLGDRLIVDGKETAIHEINSKYMYEAGAALHCDIGQPLDKNDAYKLRELLDMCSWERQAHARYIAGWIALAPICGALKWRPHIWITGKIGTGKTFVTEDIVGAALSGLSIQVVSESSAAGVRQELKNDSLPVVWDEVDTDTQKGEMRVQEMLGLARQACSDTHAAIIKGTQGGRSVRFITRSMFLMSSINPYILQASDASRINVLTLCERTDPGGHKFEAIKQKKRSFLTPEWCARFYGRSVKMIPTIRHNAEIFAQVVADKTGRRRIGDQNGTLLAGAYSLSSDSIIDIEHARKIVDETDWEEQRVAPESTDEFKCLNQIMNFKLRVPGRDLERSVAELLDRHMQLTKNPTTESWGEQVDEDIILRRHGIRLDADEALIYISESHTEIKKILTGTPYSSCWGQTLKRITGATRTHSMRFHGPVQRAIGIPWNTVFGDAAA